MTISSHAAKAAGVFICTVRYSSLCFVGSSSASRSKREDTQQIRQWAKDNGHNPSARGRINQSIIDAYNEAH